jgi:pimeloyl-ACP methyl ester carboxylesterase
MQPVIGGRIAVHGFTLRFFRFALPAVFLACVLTYSLPAQAQLPILSSDFFLTTPDKVSIHVHRKVIGSVGGGFAGASVLLVHGTWGDARTWDFPGRSVMDRLAAEGYDVYALDLRGMGSSDKPTSYFTIDIGSRVIDAATVAGYILATTHHPPVVLGWSQGGVITGLLAANEPQLVAGVGLLSVAEEGFTVPTNLFPVLEQVILSGEDRFFPTEAEINGLVFGPLMSTQAEDTFYSISEPDAVPALEQEAGLSAAFDAAWLSAWSAIKVPALVADGALDPLVGPQISTNLYNALGTAKDHKQLVIFPFNSHAWFLENNHDINMLAVDLFLFQFRSPLWPHD